MVRAMQVPEHADGGWWYVVPARTTDAAVLEPDLPAGTSGWCAWYGEVSGQTLCTVRSPDPLSGAALRSVPPGHVIAAAHTSGELSATAKPFGRVRGR